MKKSVITLDVDDVLTMMRQSSSKLFSTVSASVNKTTDNSIELLCSKLNEELTGIRNKIRQNGHMIMRIISPVLSELTVEELSNIIDRMQEHKPEHFIFGVETDDSTDQLTADLIFEVDDLIFSI